ncbi:hypothetical protein MettiDRAFT_1255 [Methanolobus tindarius DSM 2278]|uniref:Uncharacterized protein n=1 Tax=Methanolobus tindarius DSM 2278 TaxID=1090322 RepID=W9DQW4_METTI|nr:hypothetical protein [Methanolobus tindarius]ETA67820.1 hypothetical protein MettiDRAFT_1255 [Methanolobus tindarius DSM 2278]
MGQNKNTGRAGNNFGHRMAVYAAQNLGTELLNTGTKSNEVILDGQRVVLKSAHKKTSAVGVTLNVLENIQSIVAVLENKEKQEDDIHNYTIYKVPVEWYKQHMKPSRSSERAARTTRMVNCNLIRKNGEVIGELTCNF